MAGADLSPSAGHQSSFRLLRPSLRALVSACGGATGAVCPLSSQTRQQPRALWVRLRRPSRRKQLQRACFSSSSSTRMYVFWCQREQENKPKTWKQLLAGAAERHDSIPCEQRMWTAGLGMHVSAVVVQIQLTPEDPLYPLVHDHLHRLWSHNIFQSGYFGLLLLLSWSNSLQKPRKDCWFVLQILWSILMGVAYTIVAQATQTVILTTSFYIASITLVFFVISSTTKLGNLSDVFTSVAVSSTSGFLVMLACFQKNSQ